MFRKIHSAEKSQYAFPIHHSLNELKFNTQVVSEKNLKKKQRIDNSLEKISQLIWLKILVQ